ncbi:TPA: cold shock domain-containing protein [Neisseria meningitidis]|uniref:Cold-shock protein n=1 Tax=Neisseria meningitidis TaxID=487 RepID=A0A378VRE0_NEIME|nr:cold shock domain-containing protein [Neisseria meningitidis]ARB69807.1 cold shock domain-containing protein [Neisseria meningitidis]EOC13420.1 'Cold-shock' DNA-binding domain protein [Neisseria meningitidis 81858]MBG8972457.1 cold shock domain-containing protein [Neisseria meningitidis]MBG9007289.1 cold shock domain-containing protein [Neisseria meningitidis]MBG9009404.1 cold shock domain-containing protein [Neisseria meningitidis]
MIGFVKWYSYEKDFGFIFGEDGHEYFFRKSTGSDIPGQIVNFEPFEHSRGLRARKVSDIHNPDPQQFQKLKTLCKDFQKVEKQPMSKKDNLLSAAILSLCLTMFITLGFFYILAGFFDTDRETNIVLLFVFPAVTFSVLTFFLNKIFRNMKLGSDADVVTNNDWLSEDSLNPFIYDPAYSNLSCNIFHRSNDD